MRFLDCFKEKIISKGYDYFINGNVYEVSFDGNDITGKVVGSNYNKYSVRINLKHPRNSVCTCPHAQDGHMCKHMVAMYFEAFPSDAAEYEEQIHSYYEEYDYCDEWEYEYDSDYNDEIELSYFEKPIFYDELLNDYIDSLSQDELKKVLLKELCRNEERTYNEYLSDYYESIKNLDQDNPKYLIEDLKESISRKVSDLFCDNEFMEFSLEEKRMIDVIYNSEDKYLRKRLEDVLFQEKLYTQPVFMYVLDFYKNKLSNSYFEDIKEELGQKLVLLKKMGIKDTLQKSNVLIHIYIINKIIGKNDINELAESLKKNAKYKEYLEFVVDDIKDIKELYDVFISKIEEHSFSRNEFTDIIYMMYQKTKDFNMLKMFYYYSILFNEDIDCIDKLKEYDDYEILIKEIINKCKKDYILERIYIKLDMCKELFELYYDKDVDYKLIRHCKYLSINYKNELVDYFKKKFLERVIYTNKREEYKEVCNYVSAILICNDNNTIDYLYNYVLTQFPKRTALHEEFKAALLN